MRLGTLGQYSATGQMLGPELPAWYSGGPLPGAAKMPTTTVLTGNYAPAYVAAPPPGAAHGAGAPAGTAPASSGGGSGHEIITAPSVSPSGPRGGSGGGSGSGSRGGGGGGNVLQGSSVNDSRAVSRQSQPQRRHGRFGGIGRLGAAAPGTAITPCNWFQSIFGGYYTNAGWITCADAAASVGTVPANSGPGGSPTLPAQAAIAEIGTDPTPPDGYTAVSLGADSSGAQQYAYVPSSDTQAQINAQAIADQMAVADTGTTDTTGTDCSWLDTPGVFNNLFNPACGTPWGIIALAGIALVAVLGGAVAGRK
jgi:hypothetical protein